MKRENFQSRIGFLLVSAGCAIGIGNVWKFPYVAGENGGGVFVLFYLLFLLIMGVPVLTMELAVGRASRKSAVNGYKTLEKPGSKWHIHGWFCMLGCYLLMMYYTTVSGWMTDYFIKFAAGDFPSGMTMDEVGGVFNDMLANPGEMGIWMAVTVIIGFIVCSFGLQKGLERISKIMMAALIVLIVVLAVHSVTLEGAMEGVRFYLMPDFERAAEVGIGQVMMAAMNQSFFTLSLGIGAMEIFGGYMKKDHTLTGEAVRICGLDTFVAVMAGMIIFPACFSFGVQPDSGPSLIFVTLPNVFVNMAGGRIWGALFFLFMSFAAFSTIIAVFQNIIQFARDMWGISLKKSVLINGVLLILLAVPCVLGMTDWAGFSIGGKSIMDIEDFLVSNNLLPIGSLVYLLFCMTRYGWGWDNFIKEANTGSGVKFPTHKAIRFYLTFILPLIVLFIFVQGYWGLIAG